MTEIEIAWLAGLIEGEGCIRSPKQKAKTIGIDLASTDKDVIEKAAALMQCSFHTHIQTNPKWKTQYKLLITGQRASEIMKLILPHMCLRRSAKINDALFYWENRIDHRRWDKSKREKYQNQLSELSEVLDLV